MKKRDNSVSDFEIRVIEFHKSNDHTTLLDSLVEYCEINNVDYEKLSKTIKFNSFFIGKLRSEANERNLLKKEKITHGSFDV